MCLAGQLFLNDIFSVVTGSIKAKHFKKIMTSKKLSCLVPVSYQRLKNNNNKHLDSLTVQDQQITGDLKDGFAVITAVKHIAPAVVKGRTVI